MLTNKLPRGVLEIPKGTTLELFDGNDFNSKHEQIKYYLQQLEISDDNMKTKQKLEDIYVYLLINFCKESIMKQIEQDLWNNNFKKSISELQNKMRCKDKVENAKAQVNFHLFLEYSIGFYHSLLNLLCQKYHIVLPCIVLNDHTDIVEHNDEVTDKDIRYLIQYCYVHIGDLFRYQGDFKQASHYYNMAIQIEPYSGHAYNQLAILESAIINRVGILSGNFHNYMQTLMFYDFACTCKNPFPATRINLESILRQITDQSVSELLTSGNKLAPTNDAEDSDNGLFYIASAWLHIYAESRLRNNFQRCKQLQQRVIEWIYEHFRRNNNKKHWKTFAQLMALQCGLISNNLDQQNTNETQLWSSNIQQFTCDILNSLSRAILTSSSSSSYLLDTFKHPGSVGFITIFLGYLHQYVNVAQKESPLHISSSKASCPIKVAFGEDFVKLLNILMNESDVLSMTKEDKITKLPVDLVELHTLRGYVPLKIPYIKYQLYSPPIRSKDNKLLKLVGQSDERIMFILSIAKQIANKWRDILLYNDKEKKFIAIAVTSSVELSDDNHRSGNGKTSHSGGSNVNSRTKPVNIALQSLRNNLRDNNVKPPQNISASNQVSTINTAPVVSGPIDTKLAKCIQEQITASTPNNNNNGTTTIDSYSVNTTTMKSMTTDSSQAPFTKPVHTPGLISNINLPSNYLLNSINQEEHAENIDNSTEKHNNNSSCSGGILANINSRSYNPNREMFEKDLPPRFANKRNSQQKDGTKKSTNNNSGGFSSMSFWDTMKSNDDASINVPSHPQPDLSKKESELLMLPHVPNSWLTEPSFISPSNTNKTHDKPQQLDQLPQYPFPFPFTVDPRSNTDNDSNRYQNGPSSNQQINNNDKYCPTNSQNQFKQSIGTDKNQSQHNLSYNNNKFQQPARNVEFPPPPNFFHLPNNSMQFNQNHLYNNYNNAVDSNFASYSQKPPSQQQHMSSSSFNMSHLNMIPNYGNSFISNTNNIIPPSFGHGNPLLNLLPTYDNNSNNNKDGS